MRTIQEIKLARQGIGLKNMGLRERDLKFLQASAWVTESVMVQLTEMENTGEIIASSQENETS